MNNIINRLSIILLTISIVLTLTVLGKVAYDSFKPEPKPCFTIPLTYKMIGRKYTDRVCLADTTHVLEDGRHATFSPDILPLALDAIDRYYQGELAPQDMKLIIDKSE